MTRSLSRGQALVLGLSVFFGLGLGGFGIFSIGDRQWLWTETFHLRAGFGQIHGVEVGTRVRVLGRDAGEVEQVELPEQPSGPVTLRLRLDGKLRRLVRADASAQIVSEGMIGGKVVEIHPGSDAAEVVKDGAQIATRQATEMADVLVKVSQSLDNLGKGEGSLGKLLKEDDAYQQFVQLVREGRGTMTSLQQDADALKSMPLVRNYVRDPHKELIRPDCERHRQYFAESQLFEPGRAVLTDSGRQHLDELAPWLNGLKPKGSEVVIVSYTRPGPNPEVARILTQKQSEATSDYLTRHHSVHKLGWFSRRKVTALGLGTDPPPEPEKDKLPLPRTEVVVFVPSGQ